MVKKIHRLAQMTTQVGGVTINQYAYTYNQQDLRAGEAAVEPEPPTPYADELVNYAYNNVNELTTMSDPGQKTLVYDASGNLTQGYTPETYVFTATYDSFNRLATHTYTDSSGAVNQTDFFYVGRMLLKKKTYLNGALTNETRYVYDGALVVQERNASENVVREYTWGAGLPGGIGGLLHLSQGGAPYAYTYDGKGNVTALLDGVGNVAAAFQYDPFGVPKGPANSLSQPMQFSTKPYDEKTGLSYYGFRFYAPVLGRWMTRDPIGEKGGINLFAFVQNNPTNLIDPFGLVDLNLFPTSDLVYRSYFDRFNFQPYFYSVGGHGRPYTMFDENNKPVSPADLAQMMIDKGWSGEPVALLSCSTGRGKNSFAAQLANILGVDVWAPTIDITPGHIYPGPPGEGVWRHFPGEIVY